MNQTTEDDDDAGNAMVHREFGPGIVCDMIHQSLRDIKGSNKTW